MHAVKPGICGRGGSRGTDDCGSRGTVDESAAMSRRLARVWFVKKRKSLGRWIASVIAFFVVVALVAVGALWWANHNRYHVEAAEPLREAQSAVKPATGDSGSVPDVRAAVAKAAKDPALGRLSAAVTDVQTGKMLWSADPQRPLVPASSTKVLTAAAAVLALQGDQRQSTKVLHDGKGNLTIVSDGDVTLSSGKGESLYTQPGKISDLAKQVQDKLGSTTVASITVDNSARAGDVFNSTWDKADIVMGNVANLDAVMLDAGRIDATEPYSARSRTPGSDVAAELAKQLGAKGAKISLTDDAVPNPGQPIAEVTSAPLDIRLRDMMVHSDNLLAESIGRQIAQARNKPHTFKGATEATMEVLHEAGIDLKNCVLHDNSGMSDKNRLTAKTLDEVLANEKTRPLLDMLPVSSAEGTLQDRYGDGSGAETAAGWVRAKTGTLSGVSALAGTVTTKDGRPVTFAFLSNGSDVGIARPALDKLAAALRNAE